MQGRAIGCVMLIPSYKLLAYNHVQGFQSITYPAFWRGSPPSLSALCVMAKLPAPCRNALCNCGIHSRKQEKDYRGDIATVSMSQIIVEVRLVNWGRIIEGTRGYRSENAKIDAIIGMYVNCVRCLRYVEIGYVNRGGRFLCETCYAANDSFQDERDTYKLCDDRERRRQICLEISAVTGVSCNL